MRLNPNTERKKPGTRVQAKKPERVKGFLHLSEKTILTNLNIGVFLVALRIKYYQPGVGRCVKIVFVFRFTVEFRMYVFPFVILMTRYTCVFFLVSGT